MGKPIGDALSVDLAASVRCMRWTGEAIDKVYDEVAPTGRDELGLVTREPLGVVAAIVPWNFPLLMAIWKIAPALARSEEHTSELQSLMRISYAVFCLKKKTINTTDTI